MKHPAPAPFVKAMLALPLVAFFPPAHAQVLREYWLNLNGTTLTSLTTADRYVADMPTGRDLVPRLQAVHWNGLGATENFANSYGQRLTGYLTAPTTGAYTFWIRGDDHCEFALSTDEDPANAVPVAWVTGWTSTTEWNKYASQKSSPINLVAGQRYFFRVLHKEGSSNDHVAVGWARPLQTTTAPSEIVPGTVLSPYLVPKLYAQQQASRFLQQAAFGATHAQLTALANNGNNYTSWINAQFNLPRTSVLQQVQTWRANLAANGIAQPGASGNASVMRAIIGQMVTGEDQLRQKTAYALSQIFVISMANSSIELKPDSSAHYYDGLLQHAFGNFRDLLQHVSLHPMMGKYLSHMRNKKADPVAGTEPDENFAREVMQLFTIGLHELNPDGTPKKDANGQLIPTYTNEHITEFARVFTGLSAGGSTGHFGGDVDYLSPMTMFDGEHDLDPKILLAYPDSNHLLPARTASPAGTGTAGMADVNAALDNLFHHPNTPPFISRLLIQRFTTSNPSPAYVGRVADAFRDNGQDVRGDMKAVLKAILLDPEARDLIQFAKPEHGRKREPWEQTVHILRAFDGYTTPTAAWAELPWAIFDKGPTLDLLGIYPLRSPSVFNFYLPAYLPPGEMSDRLLAGPEFQIHTASIAISAPNTLFTVIDGSWRNEGYVHTDLSALNTLAGDPAALVDRVSLLLDANTLSPLNRKMIVEKVTAAAQADRPKLAVRLLLLTPDFNVLQ